MLGDLRRFLQPHVRERVVAEIDKDLTKTPSSQILSHIENVIAL
jgi:protein required for attachment to host cells